MQFCFVYNVSGSIDPSIKFPTLAIDSFLPGSGSKASEQWVAFARNMRMEMCFAAEARKIVRPVVTRKSWGKMSGL